MPNSATQLYHKNPDLQVVLDFLGRCAPDAQQVTAHYQEAHELDAVKAACSEWSIHPVDIMPAPEIQGGEQARPGLVLDREAWLALAEDAMSLLAQELRKRLPAINAALKLVPVPWDALALPDSALAAWGTAADMIALPGRTVFDYLGSRYPVEAAQRGNYAIITDVGRAVACLKNHALGFFLAKEGTQNFACQRDDWRREMVSGRSLLDEHLALMLKIGLQMLEAGATGQLKALHTVLALAGDAPSLVRLHTLLEIYEDHVASYGAGQNRFRNKLLKNCLDEFGQWQSNYSPMARKAPVVPCRPSSIGAMREWKWVDSDVAAIIAASAEPAPDALPATLDAPAMDAPVVADGVLIPRGVTVADGAHVRVCAISSGSCLKPGTVLHGDVSIASHTRFDGPVTIMNNVRIGSGLTFGAGLILGEGATISAFKVKCRLPRGTRIGGSLRVGANARIGNDVTFGAENWIGEQVYIGENVRFGPYVKVDDGISIGANAWIKGQTRLIGNVPENAEVAVHAADMKTAEKAPVSPGYAIGIPSFIITKNETVRDRLPVQRLPLSAKLDDDQALQDNVPYTALQGGESPDRRSDNTPPSQTRPLAAQSPAATRTPRPEPRTPPVAHKTEATSKGSAGKPPVHPDAPAGVQRKRAGDAMVEPAAKRLRTGLEMRYREAEPGGLPSYAADGTADDRPDKPFDLSRLLSKSAFQPVQATATTTTTTTTASTAWLDQQRPIQGLSDAATTPASTIAQRLWHSMDGKLAGMPAAEAISDRKAQRLAWHESTISKENQNALERAMRQTIRVPAHSLRDKVSDPASQQAARKPAPMHAVKGPNL